MTILKIELIEGEELLYKNPYGKGIEVALSFNLMELKENPREKAWILGYDHSVSYHIKPGIPIYILTLPSEEKQ